MDDSGIEASWKWLTLPIDKCHMYLYMLCTSMLFCDNNNYKLNPCLGSLLARAYELLRSSCPIEIATSLTFDMTGPSQWCEVASSAAILKDDLTNNYSSGVKLSGHCLVSSKWMVCVINFMRSTPMWSTLTRLTLHGINCYEINFNSYKINSTPEINSMNNYIVHAKERRQWPKPRFRASGLELQLGHGDAIWRRRRRGLTASTQVTYPSKNHYLGAIKHLTGL